MAHKDYLNKETQEVLSQYRAQVIEDHYRSRKRVHFPIATRDLYLDESIDTFSQEMRVHSEPLVTIELPHSSLDSVVENLTRYHTLLEQFTRSSYRGSLTDDLQREHYLRRNSAGVRKAWDHYQLMLRLAWEGGDVE